MKQLATTRKNLSIHSTPSNISYHDNSDHSSQQDQPFAKRHQITAEVLQMNILKTTFHVIEMNDDDPTEHQVKEDLF